MKSSHLFFIRILLVAAFAGVVAFLALRSSPFVQVLPWMPRRLGLWADAHGITRNAVAFFAFGFVVFALLGAHWSRLAALSLFAIALEVAQRWIPGRIFDGWDIVASLVGLLTAWMFVGLLRRLPAFR